MTKSQTPSTRESSKKERWMTWRLRPKADQRVRAHHPWVYSNELAESPKGIEPGQLIELQDAQGQFLARGYGNPSSLIAFRVLSRDSQEDNVGSVEYLVRRLERAYSLRQQTGFSDFSHRLIFGEADFIPGLVVDRYRLAQGQVFCVQAHTAGADRLLTNFLPALEIFVRGQGDWNRTGVIFRNDLHIRKLEGIAVEDPKVVRELTGVDFTRSQILVRPVAGNDPVLFDVDLLYGQKTGFFLDQFANIQLTIERALRNMKPKGPIHVADLCCYVGQWGTQLTRALKQQGLEVVVHAVDVSTPALDRAQTNMTREGAQFQGFRLDVLEELGRLAGSFYDIVICDPPALIKGRKDIGPGRHGYLKLNTAALQLLKPGGVYVACSCSGLLEENEFLQILAKASRRTFREIQWLARGGPAPDHPVLLEFPEGHYLKAWVGRDV